MQDPLFYVTIALSALAAVAILALAALRGWRGWLDLKQAELAHSGARPASSDPSAAARIEVADLRERIRKLEAIAAGVDL